MIFLFFGFISHNNMVANNNLAGKIPSELFSINGIVLAGKKPKR